MFGGYLGCQLRELVGGRGDRKVKSSSAASSPSESEDNGSCSLSGSSEASANARLSSLVMVELSLADSTVAATRERESWMRHPPHLPQSLARGFLATPWPRTFVRDKKVNSA